MSSKEPKKNAMYNSEFMTAKEKALVLRQWSSFLRSLLETDEERVLTDYGFLPKKQFHRFTKTLYRHLSLHCMFIAHYNRAGFFATYFVNPKDTIRFLGQFDASTGFKSVEHGSSLWVNDPSYSDVNRGMCDIFATMKEKLYAKLRERGKARDLAIAQTLLSKYGLAIQGE
jgi:hypothetical protein